MTEGKERGMSFLRFGIQRLLFEVHMEHRTLTFVYGPSHYLADQYIRKQVAQGTLRNADCRNITNPDSLQGLTGTENTSIRFVWLAGCKKNRSYGRFKIMMAQRQFSGANIQEVVDA